jgi:hypothetical protein
VRARIRLLVGALALGPGLAAAAAFQFQVLAASPEWLVLRENLPATSADTAACPYEGLDPSDHVGVRVHFIRLPAAAAQGGAVPAGPPEHSVDVLQPRRSDTPCTPADEARARWAQVADRARALGLDWPATPVAPQVLGRAVPAARCDVLAGAAGAPCRTVLDARVRGGTLRIGVALAAVPVAPDGKTCQFVGHRLAAVLQVGGLDFGRPGRPAPGGVVEHADCRAQQFMPLRLYALGDHAALLATFRGASIADRTEHAFVMVFPTRAQP